MAVLKTYCQNLKIMTESEYFQSEKFREDFRKKVEQDICGKGKPMVYIDENNNIVEHWKDGTINIIKYATKENN